MGLAVRTNRGRPDNRSKYKRQRGTKSYKKGHAAAKRALKSVGTSGSQKTVRKKVYAKVREGSNAALLASRSNAGQAFRRGIKDAVAEAKTGHKAGKRKSTSKRKSTRRKSTAKRKTTRRKSTSQKKTRSWKVAMKRAGGNPKKASKLYIKKK